MKRKSRLSLILAIVALLFSWQGRGEALSPEDEKAIRAEMSEPGRKELRAKEFADQYGKDAIPVLLDILKSGDRERYYLGNVCHFLGVLGAQEALEPMKERVDRVLSKKDLSEREFDEIRVAFLGIGHLGSDDAISYLKQFITGSYWAARDIHPTVSESKYDEGRTQERLQAFSILALGMAGNQNAIDILTGLQRQADSSSPHKLVIKGAISNAEKLRTGVYWKERRENPKRRTPLFAPISGKP